MKFNSKKYHKKYYEEYKLSNEMEFDLDDFPEECREYVDEIKDKNYEFAEDLIKCLNEWWGIPNVIVNIYCKPRLKSKEGKDIYGEYISSTQGKPAEIKLWMLTHVEKLVGPEEMLRTIIEEWMHHWDSKVLKLTVVSHCEGFKHRINQIMKKLKVRKS